jgi:FlaA1/EpsC-like NDP-sugar epimerase
MNLTPTTVSAHDSTSSLLGESLVTRGERALARWLPSVRNRHLFTFDLVALCLIPLLGFAARYEGLNWSPDTLRQWAWYTALSVPLRLAVLWITGMYSVYWRYATLADVLRIAWAGLWAGVVGMLVGFVLIPEMALADRRVPVSVVVLGSLLTIAAISLPRLGLRILSALSASASGRSRATLIVGAGAAGQLVLRTMGHGSSTDMVPVGFLDDDPAKRGLRIGGVEVRGTLDDLIAVARRHKVRDIIIAMPSVGPEVIRRIVADAAHLGVAARTVPSLEALLTGQLEVGSLRRVQLTDLLNRDPVVTDLRQIAADLFGKRVLVTGAGGSIGSELCRQIARCAPAEVILLGHGENSIFEIYNELCAAHPDLKLHPCIADVRDARRLAQIVSVHRPEVIFHAAAHKHVPLMEANVIEAVTNNVLGTNNLLEAAQAAGTGLFVLISTDKAVRPTSVMGTTKRVAELLVQRAAQRSGQRYVTVRFGNVLGSRGSVVPTFLKQIEAGGPVKVTHPEMRRYFMTIPEAVQLVLQAAAQGQGGELFALDMGEPVKIADMARDLIRLAGREPGVDIQLEFTGMRPGEKLYEEVFQDDALVERTAHPQVLRVREAVPDTKAECLLADLMKNAAAGAPPAELLQLLAALVPDWAHEISGTTRTKPQEYPLAPSTTFA